MDNAQHTLNLVNRESLNITGVTDVDEFNDEEIVAICDSDELRIKGELLHIEELSIDNGTLTVSGKISSLTYSQKLSGGSLMKRLFGA